MLRKLYESLIPGEARLRLYKLRNPSHFRMLRSKVYRSEKGDFSLRSFDNFQCIFVHITRTGGTSVAKSLFGELPYHYTALQYRIFFGKRDFERYYKFTVVRNPWDRLYSAYKYLKAGGWDEKDRTWAEDNLRSCDTFDDFVLGWLTPPRLQSNIHFWPQTQFICDRKDALLVDSVARFESLAADVARISDRLGIKSTLLHDNRSSTGDYRSAYGASTIGRVGDLYSRDIRLLGYEFDRTS